MLRPHFLFALIVAAVLGLGMGEGEAVTPGQKAALFGGGYQAAYLCNYLNGAFCGGESYSTTSLRTVVDQTGVVTYAPNNLYIWTNDQTTPFWTGTYNTNTTSTTTTVTFNGSNSFRYGGALFNLQVGVSYIESVLLSSGTKTGIIILREGLNGTPLTVVSLTPTPTRYFLKFVATSNNSQPGLDNRPGIGADGLSGSVNVSGWSLSAVTNEMSPRPSDQVVTTSAVYYGPAFDHVLGTGAPLGYRNEAAATNLYLNSGAPATQTITVANATQYTGSIRQTGTQAFTGAFTATLTGAANTVVQTTQTSATTSLVATDTGLAATSYPQVEVGAFATSPIIAGASATARAADSITLVGLLAALKVTNPIIVERQSEATGTISRTLYAKNTFAFATGYWYRQLVACPANEPTAALNAIVAGSGALHC